MSASDQIPRTYSNSKEPAGDEVFSDEPLDDGQTASADQDQFGSTFTPSSFVSTTAEGEQTSGEDGLSTEENIQMPMSGSGTAGQHLRTLSFVLVLSLLVLAGMVMWAVSQGAKNAGQVAATGQALMESERLAKAMTQALVGAASAFPEVKDSAETLSANALGLQSGGSGIEALGGEYADDLGRIMPLVQKAKKNADVVLAQQKALVEVGAVLRRLSRKSSDLLEVAEAISAIRLQREVSASAPELAAISQLVMLTQRIGKSASEFLTFEGVSPEAVFLLGKDLNTFKELTDALLNGDSEMRIAATRDPQVRERLNELLKQHEETQAQAASMMANLQGLVSAREAQVAVLGDSDQLRKSLAALQGKLSSASGLSLTNGIGLGIPALLAILSAFGLGRVLVLESRARQQLAEQRRQAAEQRQLEVRRVNDANQAAILRLMNELQAVAEGDLTQEATVTEDITGAIADSVNYTVEELRSLVGSVQNTTARVGEIMEKTQSTSTDLLAASTEQLREIRETGQSVLEMAGRINDVSGQAQQSAAVARQSLQAAERGLSAVQNAIGGMNTIRDQIQETSKRIKRLGESSQEIGEITELIADITEQTNVLALNAAIQAASAGEAGRGFSVVAEEVQRLAERSGDATRQIAALVKAIQTDTQDAVAAMERSTQGVVEGARLSDHAGAALSEIDRVSRQLAELIERISTSASNEADQAGAVATNIRHIFAVTEQTGEGTRTNTSQVQELARMSEELRQSVARFKVV
ncbi:MAG: methyl-accepting chemotaxis protein [Burkholderiaceae bacterium]|jgi:twitching motility protein PilJ|nr:methyl-accepting chemotaxis protein [Burkholderiaceae bacterium]